MKEKGIPQFWRKLLDGTGATVLTYAVRESRARFWIGLIGLLSGGAALWMVYWLLSGGGLTVAGVVFLLLVPGCGLAFALHCLNIGWYARSEYTFTADRLVAKRYSLTGNRMMELARAEIVRLAQNYSPPGDSSPTGSTGTWVTILSGRDASGKEHEMVFDGFGSPEEARWLGAWLADWTGLTAKRGFSSSFEEADEKELPDL